MGKSRSSFPNKDCRYYHHEEPSRCYVDVDHDFLSVMVFQMPGNMGEKNLEFLFMVFIVIRI